MATAPGRPPPKAFVRAARTSKPLDAFGFLGAGDFLRPAGFLAGDLARGLRGEAAAEALAARVATMLAEQCLLLKFWDTKLGDGVVLLTHFLGRGCTATAMQGVQKSPAKAEVNPHETKVMPFGAAEAWPHHE